MIVFNMYGTHTGDAVLSLPAANGLAALGYEVGISSLPKYYDPIKFTGMPNVLDKEGHTVLNPKVRGLYSRAEDWIEAAKIVDPNVVPVKKQYVMEPSALVTKDTIVLQPWCEDPAKQLPLEFWQQLAEAIGGDVAVCAPDLFYRKAKTIKARNLCGQDKGDWARTIASCKAVVSIDSGAVHVADMLGIPCVSLYTRYMPSGVWRPYWDTRGVMSLKNKYSVKVKDVVKRLKEITCHT